jgi:hypothetical protein
MCSYSFKHTCWFWVTITIITPFGSETERKYHKNIHKEDTILNTSIGFKEQPEYITLSFLSNLEKSSSISYGWLIPSNRKGRNFTGLNVNGVIVKITLILKPSKHRKSNQNQQNKQYASGKRLTLQGHKRKVSHQWYEPKCLQTRCVLGDTILFSDNPKVQKISYSSI